MSETSCKTCKVKTSWSRGADITNEGYRCLSCSTLFYRQQNKRYQEALSFVESELYEVLHENKELNVKMFHIENAKRMITKVLNGEDEE